LQLQGGSTATTTTGNITGNVNMLSGSTLNLGANLSLSGAMDVKGTGSVVNMNGNNISAGTIYLGWNEQLVVTVNRGTTPGSLSATSFLVYGQDLNLLASDQVTNFYLNDASTTFNSGASVSYLDLLGGSTATTTAAGNITGAVSVFSGSTLNLGANLSPSGSLDVEGTGSTMNAHGYNISANQFTLGSNGTVGVSVANVGQVNVNQLVLATGSTLSIQGGAVGSLLSLSGNSVLTVHQTNGTV
jgi:hypothetical protein